MKVIHLCVWVLALALALGASAQEVYKTIDENGKVIFSDKPGKDSVEVDAELQNVQPPVNFTAPIYNKNQKEAPDEYTLRLLSPTNEQQIGPIQKSLNIQAAVEPALQRGHFLQFYFDSEALGKPGKSTRASIPLGIKKRGKREVKVNVVDHSGRVIASSPAIYVYVIRP